MLKALRTHKAADTEQIWKVLKRTSLRKTLRFGVAFVRHLPALMPLLLARRGSNLRRLVNTRPEIFRIVLTSYMAAGWNTRTRITRLIDHYNTAAKIGGLVDAPPDLLVDVIHLAPIDMRYRITLDQPHWLMREGPLVMGLFDGVHRIFHLGFCLATENGRRVAYIGSVQGRREVDRYNIKLDILDHYRIFTKAAEGMRPRDFLVEAFKMFCRSIGVDEIRAVADANHPQRQTVGDVKLSYDEIWIERGGELAADGFFVLPVAAGRRDDKDIPAKKRAMYARRYAILDAIETDLAAALKARVDWSSETARMAA